ncbi:hypothetical protein LZK73_24500 (plasmid) [Neorhizobium galegae]|nr:hypothetical protein LZK73_24500 [Neorhizobium galegae]
MNDDLVVDDRPASAFSGFAYLCGKATLAMAITRRACPLCAGICRGGMGARLEIVCSIGEGSQHRVRLIEILFDPWDGADAKSPFRSPALAFFDHRIPGPWLSVEDDDFRVPRLLDPRQEQIDRKVFRAASLEADAETCRPVTFLPRRLRQVGLVVLELRDDRVGLAYEVVVNSIDISCMKSKDG